MVIYKIENKINGMIYIGQTTQSFEKRMIGHKYGSLYVDQEIKKQGTDNFIFEIIEKCFSKEELDERERHWIKFFNCKVPNGYNKTDGGRRIYVKKVEFANRIFRLPAYLVERLAKVAQEQGVSMNNLVMQCCEYALNEMNDSNLDKSNKKITIDKLETL